MKKNGLTMAQLNKLLKKWQKIFLMNDWRLDIEIVDFKRKDYRQSGDFRIGKRKKQATILLTREPFRDEEMVLVHELIHVLLWNMDGFCEKLALKHSKRHEGDHAVYMDKLEDTVAKFTEIFMKKNKR
jgi:hypothetical protein